jgi:hypothetical protein
MLFIFNRCVDFVREKIPERSWENNHQHQRNDEKNA